MINSRLHLRAGEWVEVRSKQEILATLDANGRLDALPFMPEMFAFCGKRFRVWKRAHKTCDTVNKTGGRRMAAAVHLEDVRCDGAAHGGCEAACLIFWKEAWVRRVDDSRTASTERVVLEAGATEQDVWTATRASGDTDEANPTFACQATLLPQATEWLPWWDARQYLEDVTSGNVSLWELLSGGAFVCVDLVIKNIARYSWPLAKRVIGVYDFVQRLGAGVPYPRRGGMVPAGQKTPSQPIHGEPRDLVQVKTYEEILATLDTNSKNKGMFFDAEEVPYCGKTFRVRSTVSKIIDERTGKMLALKDRNVILEGAICKAHYSDRRMMCPRAIFPIWRETWLNPAAPDEPKG